ncbi:cytochrome C assembly family protein [Methyloterricola oryzae]|uniref:cytochrome C assembly family protein n=1 Tax=Methyloterricola oryzae TaxID=1495050 RepID=UPI0005EBB345|nr:cytochrome c biogenesis protein CcsA [Methyloterricola oryzae]
MNPTLPGIAAILAYAAATAALVKSFNSDYILSPVSKREKLTTLVLGWLAALFHAVSLNGMCDRAGHVNFSFLSTSSLAALSIVIILLVTAVTKPIDKLGVVIFPLAAMIVLARVVFPEEAHVLKTHSWQMNVHILVSMLSYSFLNIAALQALLVAFQDRHLRRHQSSGLVRSLPPLQTMEKLLFQLIGAGFVLLSISLISGFFFIENLFAQHLAHKTILSILAWFVFAVLLGARATRGWRGQIAIRWTLGGFLALMLAYFGSKMVLEWILKKG